MGLLSLTDGQVRSAIGIPFSFEGIFFLLEAVFTGDLPARLGPAAAVAALDARPIASVASSVPCR
jgi:hypothetical protein